MAAQSSLMAGLLTELQIISMFLMMRPTMALILIISNTDQKYF